MTKKLILLVFLFSCIASSTFALDFLSTDSLRRVNFKQSFVNVDNNLFYVVGEDENGRVYTYNGVMFEYFKPKKWALSPFMNRKILYYDGRNVRLWNPQINNVDKNLLYRTQKKDQLDCLTFSPDGTYILVVTKDSVMSKVITDSKVKDKVVYSVKLSATPSKIHFNNQSNVALVVEGNKIDVLNLERGVIRSTLESAQSVLDVDFSDDSREFVVLYSNGDIKTYNMSDLNVKKSYAPIVGAKNCTYYAQGKYLIVNASKSYEFLNLLTSNVDYVLSVDAGDLLSFEIQKDAKFKDLLLMIKNSYLEVYPLNEIERYRTLDMKYSMDLAMDEWTKMQEGESEEEYLKRMSKENREKYALQLEYDIVSQMAGNLINEDGARLGSYIGKDNLLAVDFNTLPSIYLNVPSQDLVELNNINDIEFFNTIYGLDQNDEFEVIYTDARNKLTGNVYMYDNRNREKITFVQEDFVPMEVIQIANLEQKKLEMIKEEVVAVAKTEDLLSDHTHITVSTEVEEDIDADGEKILDYNVNFQYKVDQEFSERDDFKSGKYLALESNAAQQMLAIVKKSLNSDFAKYTNDCSKIIVSVTGSADATPIRNKLRYNGEYGDIVDQIATQDGELTTMSVTKSKGIVSNEELALVRAISVGDYLDKELLGNLSIPVDYKYNIEVSKEKGSEYRRIKVSLKFVDTFKNTK